MLRIFRSALLAMTVGTSLFAGALHADANIEDFRVITEAGLKAVCYKNPREQGWEDVVSIGRYSLLALNASDLNSAIFYADSPVMYRLIVKGFPCYYSYESYRFRGLGNNLYVTVPHPPRIEIDGNLYPAVFEDRILTPIVRNLYAECEVDVGTDFPWKIPFVESCGDQVAAVLVSEAVNIGLYLDATNQNTTINIQLIMGMPYIKGELVKPW